MFNGNLQAASEIPCSNPLRAVTIVRVSTAEQAAAGKNGLERQRASNRRTMSDKGYQLVHEVELVDVSGSVSWHSPEIQDVLRMAERQEIDVIVISELSRLTRPDSLSDLALLDQFRDHGVVLDVGGVVQDIQNAAGFLAGGLQALLGGYERKMMLQKIHSSKEAARAAGRNPSADITLPLGLSYNRANHSWHYNEEVGKVQRAFSLIDGDTGLRNISEVARRTGIQPATLRNLLRNTVYIGVRTLDKKRNMAVKPMKAGARQGDRPKVARKPEEVIRVRIFPPAEQAVSDEQFYRVQAILNGLKEFNARIQSAKAKGGNLLAGTGRCGCCGLRLYATTSSHTSKDGVTKKRGHMVCFSAHYLNKNKSNRCGFGWVTKDRAEALVSSFVCSLLGEEEFLAKILEHAVSKRKDLLRLPDSDNHLRVRLADLEKIDKRIVDSLLAGVLSIPESKQARTRIAEERDAILRSIKAIDTEARTNMDPVSSRLIGRKEAWLSLNGTAERKAFLASIFAEVYLQNSKANGLVVSAFRLAPGLIPKGDSVWQSVAEIPVTLAEPFRIDPPPDNRAVGEGERICKRCDKILLLDSFYSGNKSSCKRCLQKIDREKYAKKKLQGDDLNNP
jgi:DNA invertase Pin-like site-specific DNA recombinase